MTNCSYSAAPQPSLEVRSHNSMMWITHCSRKILSRHLPWRCLLTWTTWCLF